MTIFEEILGRFSKNYLPNINITYIYREKFQYNISKFQINFEKTFEKLKKKLRSFERNYGKFEKSFEIIRKFSSKCLRKVVEFW